MPRRAFTLIEILIALILVGIGMTSILALILKGTRDAREVSVWAMSTVAAEAAADVCLGTGLLGFNLPGPVDLPGPVPGFESPYPIRVDIVSDAAGLPASAQGGPATPVTIAPTDPGALAWIRIRIYADPDDRVGGLPPLATYHVLRVIRRAPP
jgi:prepilin-type N-terminal cleavage/methylation domain-containing protein